MVEVFIKFSLDSSQPLPTVFKLTQSGTPLFEGPFSTEISLLVPDILSEINFDFEILSTAYSTSFYLLPLLTRPDFCLTLQQDPSSRQYSLNENPKNGHLKIEISSKHELDSNALKKDARAEETDKSFGVDLNEKRLGTEKYLENLLIGLNGKLIQQEAKQLVVGSVRKCTSEASQQRLEESTEGNEVNEVSGKGSGVEVGTRTQVGENRKILELEGMMKLQDGMFEQLKEENLRIKEELFEEKKKNHSLSLSIEKSKNKLANLKKSLICFQATEKIILDLKDQIDRLRSEVDEQEKSKSLFKNKLESCLLEFQSSVQAFEAHQALSDQLHEGLAQTIRAKDLEIKDLQGSNSLWSTEIQRLLGELNYYQTQSQVAEKFSVLVENSSFSVSPDLNGNVEGSSLLKVVKDRSKIDEQAEQMNALIEKLKTTQKKLEEVEENYKDQEDIIKVMVVKSKIDETNELIRKNPLFMDEFLKILEQLREINEVGSDFELKFYSMAMGYLKKINKLSELNLTFHRLFEKYFKLMYDKDCQIYMLRHIARDAQMQRNIYIPVKSDPIDVCMGDFINNRKIPLAIPLLREDQGVYNFYTRTIKVKVENNRVIVRLGGGFQGIEEFLNQNTQIELDKLEERRKFGCAEAVKKLIESDFQIIGLPAAIDHLTPPITSNETSFSSNANNSILLESLSQVQQKKRTSLLVKDSSKGLIGKKKTFN